MAFGFGVLRLSSETFWKLTPRELAAAAKILPDETARTSRKALNELIERFPDERKS